MRCVGSACVDRVTDASGFPYRPSFDGGLGRCTGAVSCGRPHLPFRVRGRHARVLRVCVCMLFFARSGGPASWVRYGAPHPLLWPVLVGSLFVRPPLGLGCPVCRCCWVFSSFFSLVAPPLPNPIPNQHDNNKQAQRQSKKDTKKITMSASESLSTLWVSRAVVKAPPFLFLDGCGSWCQRH